MNTLTRTRNNGLPGWTGVDNNPVDRMLENFFAPSRQTGANVVETENGYEWRVDMPGVGEDNINVEYNGQKSTLTVSTSFEEADESTRRRRSYQRAVRIGDGIDAENISASYENGVLTVELPKTEKEEVTRKIELE